VALAVVTVARIHVLFRAFRILHFDPLGFSVRIFIGKRHYVNYRKAHELAWVNTSIKGKMHIPLGIPDSVDKWSARETRKESEKLDERKL